MSGEKRYVISESVLPDVLRKVLQAKTMLENGICSNARLACYKAGISRSTFYKYKNCIFEYTANTGEQELTVLISAVSASSVLAAIYTAVCDTRVTVITMSQSIPVNGKTVISATIRASPGISIYETIRRIRKIDGVESLQIMGV